MTITWDTNVLPFQSVMFARRNLSRSGGLTISGTEQVVQSSSDFWEASVTLKVRTKEQALAYRAYQALNWGRAGEWIIPTCSNAPLTGMSAGGDFSADFSADFSRPGGVASAYGIVDSLAAKGTNTIAMHFDYSVIPGMYFSIGSRLYLIASVISNPAVYIITFVPKLRAAVTTGGLMEFSKPHCLMRLSQDNVGQMNLDMLRFSDVSLNFVEVPI